MAGSGLTLRGDERLKRALKQFPDRVQRGAKKGMKTGLVRVQRSARKDAPVDRGRLRQSIATEVRECGLNVRGAVGSAVDYAPYVEFGTAPHWPPLSALQPWAERHGFPPGRAGAFLVARSIAQTGTPETRFLRNAVRDNTRRVWQDIKRGIGRELDRLGR